MNLPFSSVRFGRNTGWEWRKKWVEKKLWRKMRKRRHWLMLCSFLICTLSLSLGTMKNKATQIMYIKLLCWLIFFGCWYFSLLHQYKKNYRKNMSMSPSCKLGEWLTVQFYSIFRIQEIYCFTSLKRNMHWHHFN